MRSRRLGVLIVLCIISLFLNLNCAQALAQDLESMSQNQPPPASFKLSWPVTPVSFSSLGQTYGQYSDVKAGYYHTGLDIGGGGKGVHPSAPGQVVLVQANGGSTSGNACSINAAGTCADHGFGNTVIIKHAQLTGTALYTQYSHMESFSQLLVNACGNALTRRSGTCTPNLDVT